MSETAKNPGQVQRQRDEMKFCQAPSQQWLDEYEDCGDPRLVEAQYAIRQAMRNGGGWVSPWDSRAPDLPNTLDKASED